jgi:hypothetical protein
LSEACIVVDANGGIGAEVMTYLPLSVSVIF